MNKFKLSALSGALILSGAVNASTVDFQDVTSGNCASSGNLVTSGGFNFTGNPIDPNLFICNADVIQSNTSAALIDANSLSIITMQAVNGGTFSLQSFFAGSRTQDFDTASVSTSFGLATGVEVTGTLENGNTVSTVFDFDYLNWDQFALTSSFDNLLSVTFTALGGSKAEFLIDDIVVNETFVSSVPVPAAVWLFGSGLVALVGLGRRKSRA